MKLSELLRNVTTISLIGNSEADITGVNIDSKGTPLCCHKGHTDRRTPLYSQSDSVRGCCGVV